jgi:Excalibur calcium-binding domain
MSTRRGVTLMAILAVLTVGSGTAAEAAAGRFDDCAGMRSVYPNGVAKSADSAAHPRPSWIKIKPPAVSSAVYSANRRLDRDDDSIACEVAL